MKNIKRIFGMLTLLAVVASFSVSCGLSVNQERAYAEFIGEYLGSENKVPSEDVAKRLVQYNRYIALYNFQIVDKQPGDVLPQTTVDALKKRFVIKKGTK